MRLEAVSESRAGSLSDHFSGFGPSHSILFELEHVPEPDDSAVPRAKLPTVPSPSPKPPPAVTGLDVKDPVPLLSRLLFAACDSAVLARAANAWGNMRNSVRVLWSALNAGWITPALFGSYTDPIQVRVDHQSHTFYASFEDPHVKYGTTFLFEW